MTWPCFLFPIGKEPIQRTPPFLKRTQTLVPENLHITFAFVTFIEGIPLFKGNGHLGSSIQGTVPKYSKVTMTTALTTWTISLTFCKWMYVLHLWEFYTQYCRDGLVMIFLNRFKSSGAYIRDVGCVTNPNASFCTFFSQTSLRPFPFPFLAFLPFS